MSRLKSTTKNIKIEIAARSHDCRYNKEHRINAGDQRLRIKEGRNAFNYCLKCASLFLQADIQKLSEHLELVQKALK